MEIKIEKLDEGWIIRTEDWDGAALNWFNVVEKLEDLFDIPKNACLAEEK
jgi:hypothetical protein